MSERTKGLFLGIVGSVVAGLILYLLTSLLDPRPNVRWATYGDYHLQQGINTSGFQVAIENRGRATARNIELFIEGEPDYVALTPSVPFDSELESSGFAVRIDALGANERMDVEVVGANSYALKILRVDGESIDEAFIPRGEFRRPYGVEVPLLVVLIPVVLLGAFILEILRSGIDYLFSSQTDTRRLQNKRQQTQELKEEVEDVDVSEK